MVTTTQDDEAASDRIRTISRHSLAYMLCAASEMFRHYNFDPMDLVLIDAVLNANVLNIMKYPDLDRRLGSVETIEPDAIKQGVSRKPTSCWCENPSRFDRRGYRGARRHLTNSERAAAPAGNAHCKAV